MAEHASAPAGGQGHSYFYLRRLHSLLGIVPVGVFLCFHLTVNSTILVGADKFQAAVKQIHLLHDIGLLVPVEIATIFLPLFFHAILGVYIALNMSNNVSAYRYGGNVRYLFQRITGIFAFAFIVFHLWQMHWLGKPFGGGHFDVMNAAPTAAHEIQESVVWMVFYALGVAACVYHLANGIWTALITWGITVGPRSQRVAGYVCTAFGIGLGLVGLGAVCGFASFDVKSAELDEPAAAHAEAPHDASAGVLAGIDAEPAGHETTGGH